MGNRPDPYSFYVQGQPRVEHLDITLVPDFDRKVIAGTVVLTFDKPGRTYLDTRALTIKEVRDMQGERIESVLYKPHPVLGTKLGLSVPEDKTVQITYETDPNASGLQWLEPEQTSGHFPFLFSQGETINARSYVPCQDTPAHKGTFLISLVVPKALRGLAAATYVGSKDLENGLIQETWKSTKPLPPYLIAFAVGDVVAHDLSDYIRVWAEPDRIDAAIADFADLPAIMRTAEDLFGPYPWDRYDLLVMPASFPYGGMENQGLTFVSPTIITGDKSLVSVVAHELAHSWFGNLVTNSTWADFWLNEGWTMWAEYKLVRRVFGQLAADLGWAGMDGELAKDMTRHTVTGKPGYNHLWLEPDENLDPDDAFSRVPYQKGFLFLTLLEETVGARTFMIFAQEYTRTFAFRTLTTAEFLQFVERELPGVLEFIDAKAWIYGPTLPANAPKVHCPQFNEVKAYAQRGEIMPMNGQTNSLLVALFLEHFRRPMDAEHLAILAAVGIARHPNTDVRFQYLLLTIESGSLPSEALMTEFLGTIGRMKYVSPLYRALAQSPRFHEQGRAWFAKFRNRYHPVAVKAIERAFRETAAG